jgi:hypothetical protein
MQEEIPAPTATLAPPKKSRSCLLIGLAVVGTAAIAIGGAIWWYNRPIRPVELTQPEIQVVEEKLAVIQQPAEEPPAVPDYQPGERQIVLTDREINGLIHQNTTLGDQIAFEFAPGAVHARIETLLPEDVPIMGGKKLRARARFIVDANGQVPAIVLEDLTVWGISLPNDWLGGLKGKNLLADMLGTEGETSIPGVESLTVERGRLVICLKE